MEAQTSRVERVYTISRPDQLAAVGSPIRQEILDVLSGLSPSSVAAISAALGRPADALYYHLRVLVRVGLVLPAGRGRSDTLYRTVAPELRLAYDPASPPNAARVQKAVASMLRLATRDFRRSFVPGVAVSGLRRELWAARSTGWLSAPDLLRVNALLREITRIFHESRRGPRKRLAALTFVLVPLDARPRRTRKESSHAFTR